MQTTCVYKVRHIPTGKYLSTSFKGFLAYARDINNPHILSSKSGRTYSTKGGANKSCKFMNAFFPKEFVVDTFGKL